MTLAAFLWLAALGAELPDEVPLIDPRLPPMPKQAAPATAPVVPPLTRASAPSPPARDQRFFRVLHIGATAEGTLKTGLSRYGGGGTVELGGRLPVFGHRFGFILTPGVFALAGGDTAATVNTLWVTVPVGVSYHERLGRGLLRARVSAAMNYTIARAQDAGGVSFDDRTVSLGLEAALGCVIVAGPGGFVLEGIYRLLRARSAGVDANEHLFSLGLGYAFYFL